MRVVLIIIPRIYMIFELHVGLLLFEVPEKVAVYYAHVQAGQHYLTLITVRNLRCSRGVDTEYNKSEAQLLQCTLDKCNEYCLHCPTHCSYVLLGLVLIQEVRKPEAKSCQSQRRWRCAFMWRHINLHNFSYFLLHRSLCENDGWIESFKSVCSPMVIVG